MLLMCRPVKAIAFVFLLSILSCSKKPAEEKSTPEAGEPSPSTDAPRENADYIVDDADRSWDTVSYETLRERLPALDLNQDLSSKTVEELRILRNTIAARYGYLFMSSDLRYYFYNTSWYTKLMEARWYGDCEYSGLKPAPPIEYTAEENAFLERVRKLENEKLQQNYLVKDGLRYPNVKNIVNTWQYTSLPPALLNALGRNGYAIVPNKNVQLFHLYEQNDYSQTQNFVSTDLYLQLFHMHFSFMLRGLEENQFVPILSELLYGIQDEAQKLGAGQGTDANGKDAAQFTSAFYSIPLMILGAKNVTVPPAYQNNVAREMAKVEEAVAAPSSLLPAYKTYYFPYDLFKPRGHYTRTDTLQRYFKIMQWLQTAPYCLENETDFTRAAVAAYVLNTGKSKSGKSLKSLYQAILEPTSFLIGQPDNVSILDLCNALSSRNINSVAALLKKETLSLLRKELMDLQTRKNVIKPKIENTCPAKINFMPSRFVLDNEILQEMADLDSRPYPKGLDVMAAFGSQAAEDVLLNEHQESKAWDQFLPQLEKMKSKYKNYEDWDATVYAKWIKGLTSMLQPDKQYPYFMQLPSWNKKNLNTALASWAELKHDAVLYTEQPFAAECGGGGECDPPPEPYVVGYVEPNVNYWKEALQLLTLTENLLSRHDLLDDGLKHRQAQLRELCTFLLTTSEKELRGQKLSEQEYRTIELIGTHVENLTLEIFGVYEWKDISGPDKEVAVVADVYTNNQGEKAGVLHAAVGYANDLYVVVEIEGYLYITKGATFSYYEFPMPLNNRMTDEEWQEMLKKGKTFPTPIWMKDVIIILDKSVQPEVKEYLYSSGC
jgi:hypothetical protein